MCWYIILKKTSTTQISVKRFERFPFKYYNISRYTVFYIMIKTDIHFHVFHEYIIIL